MSARVYWLWLATRPGVGARVAAELLEHFGNPEAIYAAKRGALLMGCGLTAAQVDALSDKSLDGADRIMEECAKKDIHILTLGDSGYPERLRNIYDPPLVLYWRGRQPPWDSRPMISIVGTRHCTTHGILMAEQLGRSLTESGFLVVSGMAQGIDGAANRGALRMKNTPGTVAVLGCGVDVCYPINNSALFGDLIFAGTLLSEYPPGSEPAGWHFPQRNRIISGLSVATVLIEAPERSGALITARLALEQGRDVYAVPGRLDDRESAGCNALIRDHEAELLTGPIQLVREYSGILRELPNEAQIDRVFRSMTGKPAKAAEPPKKPKGDPWEQIVQGTQRAGRRKAEKPAEREKETAVLEDSEKTPEEILKTAHLMRGSALLQQEGKPDTRPEDGLSSEERKILEAVRAGAQTTDQLIASTDIPAPQLLSLVTMLELDGLLSNEGGTISAL
ncbi:DNA-protecting protein DprA [Butyricicoccus sp. 1XD8-22]|nr:DNA-protecting protein DprA [Butyricicoccus sp. 1XD8-22]